MQVLCTNKHFKVEHQESNENQFLRHITCVINKTQSNFTVSRKPVCGTSRCQYPAENEIPYCQKIPTMTGNWRQKALPNVSIRIKGEHRNDRSARPDPITANRY